MDDDEEVIISIPINEDEQPKMINNDSSLNDIHIQDQAVKIHSEVNTIYLDKIIAEKDTKPKKNAAEKETKKIKLPPSESPMVHMEQEKQRKKQQLEKAYAQATKVPLKLMQIQENKMRPKNESVNVSANLTKKNSLANIRLNYTKSQDKLDEIPKQFSEGD